MTTFGKCLGRLIRSYRERSGYTVVGLAEEAFADPTKARRISELEAGEVDRPQAKTYGPLVTFLGIPKEEVEACRNTPIQAANQNSSFEPLLDVFADSPSLRDAAIKVLESEDYPQKMCLGERLIPNPASKDISDASHIVERLRGYMFLAVAEPKGMNPLLYCYWSERWQAYLIPFMKHLDSSGNNLAANRAVQDHVKRQYQSAAENTGQFLVSVKRNQEFPSELWLYAFEFYSLVLTEDFDFKGHHRWFDLERLSDPSHRESQVNGDIIRAIRACWGTRFHNLKRSEIHPERLQLGDS